MGSLRVAQGHVTIIVEWPYGALSVDDFVTTTEAIWRIFKAVGDPQANEIPAEAIEYDPSETEAP